MITWFGRLLENEKEMMEVFVADVAYERGAQRKRAMTLQMHGLIGFSNIRQHNMPNA